MQSVSTQPAAFRIVASFGAHRQIVGPQRLDSHADTDALLTTILPSLENDDALEALYVQRGGPGAGPMFDPLQIVPGHSGGWSEWRWQTVRVWTREEFAAMDRAAPLQNPPRVGPVSDCGSVESYPSRSTRGAQAAVLADSSPLENQLHRRNRWRILASGGMLLVACAVIAVFQSGGCPLGL